MSEASPASSSFDALTLPERFSLLQRYFEFDPPEITEDTDEQNFRFYMLHYDVASALSGFFNSKSGEWSPGPSGKPKKNSSR